MAAKSNLATKDEPLVVERTFDAPVALVWKALTDKEDIRQWSFEIREFAPVVGFEFQFDVEHEGFKYCHRCKVTEAIPNKRLAYTWRYEGHAGDSLVTFDLFAEGGKTRLRLAHEGLETFPKLPAFAKANFAAGWTEIVGSSLKDFVEGRHAGEMILTRVFDASHELMWKLWTEPEHIGEWWGPNGFTTTTHKMEVKAGGVWRFVMHGPDGRDYQNKITFTEVVKPERLVYKHGGTGDKEDRDLEPVSFHVTVTFAEEGGKTRLDMRSVFPSAKARDFVVKNYGAVEGMHQTLGRLDEYLTKGVSS